MGMGNASLKKIGLFGGSFNPVHLGHLRAALETRIAFELETVLMIPSARPPHKSAKDMAPASDRLNMVRMVTSSTPGLAVSDMELKRPGLSYTVDTIKRFQAEIDDAGMYLIIGLDAFLEYDTWHQYPDLFRLTPIIVLLRPGREVINLDQARELMEKQLASNISGQYHFDPSPPRFTHPDLQPVHILEVTRLSISSSRIRRLVRNNKSIRFLVPEKVRQYIAKQGLYQ
jgi:nicotinate-nucleotide adenylyltransferase